MRSPPLMSPQKLSLEGLFHVKTDNDPRRKPMESLTTTKIAYIFLPTKPYCFFLA